MAVPGAGSRSVAPCTGTTVSATIHKVFDNTGTDPCYPPCAGQAAPGTAGPAARTGACRRAHAVDVGQPAPQVRAGAARAGDRDGADDHLAEARETAVRIGTDRDDYRMCFGPTNVAIWSVGLAVEAQDGTEAVKRAAGFTPPPGAPRERVGHYWIDLARGWLLHGDRERALTALIKARHTASSRVAGFTTWCGIS